MTSVYLEVSNDALEQFRNKNESNSYIRIGVKGGGCEGFKYVVEFNEKNITDRDVTMVIDDVNFVIDQKSLKYIKGCKIEWSNKLIYTGFEFKNPNAVSKCGCGHSFTVF